MPVQLIAERFALVHAGRWVDLATGESVVLRIAPIQPSETRDFELRCAAELASRAQAGLPLIDYGYAGAERCFEARSTQLDWPSPDVERLETIDGFAQRVAAAAIAPRPGGVHVIQLGVVASVARREAGSLIARTLRPHGYVTVAAGVDLTDAVLTALCHRHVVILCFAASERIRAAGWVRRLGYASPRAHLVVDASGEDVPVPRGTWMREPAATYGSASDIPRHLRRATAFERRHRLAASARCLRAAVASAQRHRHGALQVSAATRLIELSLRRRDFQDACRAAWRLAHEIDGWPDRADAVRVAASTLIVCREVRQAETLLFTVAAEHALYRKVVPPELRICHVQVWFWQGRFERAATMVSSISERSVERLKWSGLIAWAVGDQAALRDCASALGALATVPAVQWQRALTLLQDDGHDPSGIAVAAKELALHPGGGDQLLLAVALEALTSRGLLTEASEIHDAARAAGYPREPLTSQVIEWICSEPDARRRAGGLMRDMRRHGLHGLMRWGLRRGGMHLIQSVPRLLQIVTDAEDDQTAIASACAWIEEQPGISAASLISVEGGRLVAGTPLDKLELDAGDLRETILTPQPRTIVQSGSALAIAPVRYGGKTIAAFVARGAADAAATLREVVETAAPLCAPAVRARLDAVALAASRDSLTPEILGRSPALTAVREAIARAAITGFPVLIEGESGTGKELVARALHRLSARRDRRFCAVNCAALTDDLVEAELFGYARGAFTGAVAPRAGLFEEAHLGTLFLDEIRELSARAQAKLLRALQEREIRRLGENLPRPVDVRIVAATNQPLGQAASRGDFREDLVFRLAVVRIRMPPLRDRVEDVPLLAQAFWRQLTSQTGTRARLGPDALAILSRHKWPGNVRELQNAVAALVVLAPSRGRVGARHVRQVLDGAAVIEPGGLALDDARRAFERQAIAAALARHGGRRAAAAKELGLTRQGLLKAIRRVGLRSDSGEAGVA